VETVEDPQDGLLGEIFQNRSIGMEPARKGVAKASDQESVEFRDSLFSPGPWLRKIPNPLIAWRNIHVCLFVEIG